MGYNESLDRLERDPAWYGHTPEPREAEPHHYHWGQNIPGYMPMSDDANYAATFEEARAGLIEDMRHALDHYDMGEGVENYQMARSMLVAIKDVRDCRDDSLGVTVYAASDQPHDLGLAFWVMACDEEECGCAIDQHSYDDGRNDDGSPRINAMRHCRYCSARSLDYDDEETDDDSGRASVLSASILLGIAGTGAAMIVPMVQHAAAMLGGAG